MNALALLAKAAAEVPELAVLPWRLDGATGQAATYDCGRRRVASDLDLFARLHDAGWRRGATPFTGDTWTLLAVLDRDDASLRVEGMTFEPPASGNRHGPYFAPPPPPLSRGKKALAEYREWERKVLEGAW